MFTKFLGIVAVSAVAGLGLAACDNSNNKSEQLLDTSLPTTTVVAPTDLKLASTSLGSIVTDSTGHTLYAFTNDKNGVSSCYDTCATNWPAALATDTDLSGTGITGTIGTTTRTDGTKQLTLNNWPLYRFAADGNIAGSVKGQGNKNVWFVVDAAGKLVKTSTTSSTVAQSSSNNAVPTPTTVKRTTTTMYSYNSDYGYGY